MTSDDASVLCMGELVFDLYAEGPVLGGAPLHTAVHLARAGVPTRLLTAVGADPMGDRARAFLAREGVEGIRVHPDLPTGTVSVALDGSGIPAFTIHSPAAWTDLASARPGTPPPRPVFAVFCGLGLHPAGNRRFLEELLAAWAGDEAPPLLCDLNLRPGWSDPEVAAWCLEHCHYLKVNEEELTFLLHLTGLSGPGELLRRSGLRGLCTTLGPRGALWRDAGGERAFPALTGYGPLVDTVGAGDAFTAALALGLLRGEAPEAFMDRGSRWAAQVCATRGGLPPRAGGGPAAGGKDTSP
jgi:fructokinase